MKTKLILLCFLVAASLSFGADSTKNAPATPAPKKKVLTVADLEEELKSANANVIELRKRYMDRHPKMVEQLRRVSDLEKEIAAMKDSTKAMK